MVWSKMLASLTIVVTAVRHAAHDFGAVEQIADALILLRRQGTDIEDVGRGVPGRAAGRTGFPMAASA